MCGSHVNRLYSAQICYEYKLNSVATSHIYYWRLNDAMFVVAPDYGVFCLNCHFECDQNKMAETQGLQMNVN